MESLIGKEHAGYTFVAQKPYSDRDDEPCIVVLGVRPDRDGWQFVTWIYNPSTTGYFWGSYGLEVTKREAVKCGLLDFDERGLAGQAGASLFIAP